MNKIFNRQAPELVASVHLYKLLIAPPILYQKHLWLTTSFHTNLTYAVIANESPSWKANVNMDIFIQKVTENLKTCDESVSLDDVHIDSVYIMYDVVRQHKIQE